MSQTEDATPLNFKDAAQTSWERSSHEPISIKELNRFDFVVAMENSDEEYACRIWRESDGDTEKYLGKCTCPRNRYHNAPCVHLCKLRRLHADGTLVHIPHVEEALSNHDCPTCGQELPEGGR